MRSDYEPIIKSTPWENESIRLYPIHDIHKGSRTHDATKYGELKKKILADPNAYVVFVGDAMENVVQGSKGDIFYQDIPPHEQKEWIASEFRDFAGRILAVVDGNHERNRSTARCGLFPLYDACARVGIEDLYRPHFAVLDIGVGKRVNTTNKQVRYVGYIVHQATEQVKFGSPDMIEGFDFFVSGHDHQPKDRPRGKLIYDTSNKTLREKDVEHINCGAFMIYGDYAADTGRRPSAQKMYRFEFSGKQKENGIQTVGFHVSTTR